MVSSPITRNGHWRLAAFLRAWVVVLLSFPAFGFGAAPPVTEVVETLEIAHESVIKAAPLQPVSDIRLGSEVKAAEVEEEEDAEGRHKIDARAFASVDPCNLVGSRRFVCSSSLLAVPATPLRLHRLHNRGPPPA